MEVHEGGNSLTIIGEGMKVSVGNEAVDLYIHEKYHGPIDNPRPRMPRLRVVIEELDD